MQFTIGIGSEASKGLLKEICNCNGQGTADGGQRSGHPRADSGQRIEGNETNPSQSGAQTKPISNCIQRCTARDLPFPSAVEPFMLFLLLLLLRVWASIHPSAFLFLIRVLVLVLVLFIRPDRTQSPQSQWGRHETPLLEGTLSVQRHHYFTPAQLKAQAPGSPSNGAADGNGDRRQQDPAAQEGSRRDNVAVCGSPQRAHKNGINIMAKLRNELQEPNVNRA